MAGVLVNNGQEYFLEVIFKTTSPGNLWLGLMENGTFVAPTDLPAQIGGSPNIVEVSGTGYARIEVFRNTDWTRTSQTVTTNAAKEFTVGAGGWLNVRGYFMATAVSGANVIWAEAFPLAQQGNKVAGDKIRITPSYTQKDDAE